MKDHFVALRLTGRDNDDLQKIEAHLIRSHGSASRSEAIRRAIGFAAATIRESGSLPATPTSLK